MLIFAALVATLGLACTDTLSPGTDWVVGRWQLVYWPSDVRCLGDPSPPYVVFLELDDEGMATVREDDVVTARTRFRTWQFVLGDYPVLEFEEANVVEGAIANGFLSPTSERRYGLPTAPTEVLKLVACPGAGLTSFLFVLDQDGPRPP